MVRQIDPYLTLSSHTLSVCVYVCVCVCVCVYIHIHIYIIEIYYEAIMEAKKSQDLLSVTWRPRKAGAVIQSETRSEGLRTRGANGVNLSLRSEGKRK